MTGRTYTPSRGAQNVPPGTQLNNMFEVDQLLTAGGMGEVYRGHNIQTNDPVAIKIVLPEFAQDEMILQLFRKEARVLNHLHHEAIVRYYVFSIDAGSGLPFLAMEFVDGPSLAERIRDGPLDTASVVTLQRRLADGLQKAHEGGIIHRDIAPDNVILPEGRVDRAKIIDFGIARSAAVGGGTLLGGAFAGKYGYVSPEQLGLFGGDVTYRSDIYSLGLVLAACARGRPIDMSGTQVEVIEKRRVVPDLSGIDPALVDLFEAMLQPDPEDRPQSMAEVAAWPTLEPEAKTEIWHPSTRHPARGPADQPTSPTGYPAGPPPSQHPSSPPGGQPDSSPARRYPSQPASAPPSPLAVPDDMRREPSLRPQTPTSRRTAGRPQRQPAQPAKRRLSPGLVVLGLFLSAAIVAGVGGWAYVEYWSDGWYSLVGPADEELQPSTDEPLTTAEERQAAEEETQIAEEETQEPVEETQEPMEETQDVAEEPQTPAFAAADIRRFVDTYDGGSCFFVRPTEISDRSAEIIGYGNRRQPFDGLRRSFQQRFKFEPMIEFRNVLDAQCVVLEALASLASQAASSAPRLELANDFIRSGGSLSGTLSGLEGRHLAVLMVDNAGTVYDLADYTETQGDTAQFSIPLYLEQPMEVAPQLVIAIASPEPLTSLDLDQPRPASDLAPDLLDEAAATPSGLGTAVGYFKFGS